MSPVATGVVGLLVGALLVAVWASLGRRRARVAVRRAAARGLAGERAAIGILETAGYRVLEEQPAASYAYWIDGEAHTAEMCPDLLVARAGEVFVVEVKTGRGRRPTMRGTRRQLLEYATYFDVDGALLVDAEDHRIHAVEFPDPLGASRTHARPWLTLLVLATGAALGWLARGPH